MTASAEYHAHRVSLRPTDRLALFTDGLFERRDELPDDGLDRLARTLERLDGLEPQLAVERLGASVTDPFDDLAALVVDLGST